MNKERRKALKAISEILDGAKNDLETLRDEEQEYLDNMPENMQQGEKGQNAETAVSEMYDGISGIEDAISNLEDVIGNLETASE